MRLATTTAVLLALSCAAPAFAQESAAEPYIKLDCPDLGDQTPKQASRDNCHQLATADKKMFARLKIMLRPDIHEDDGKLMARNYKHVVMAYAALWILAVVFLVLLFLRQRALTDEIVRLKRELDRAIRDEEEEE